jgi:phage repressor protein C with HTH and peptisase S24 domain
MSDFQQRLIKVRTTLHLSQSAFAQGLETKRPTLIGYENGPSQPAADFLAKLRKKYDVNIDWLLTGEEPMFLDKKGATQETEPAVTVNLPEKREGVKVPLLRQKVSCGPGSDWEAGDNIEAYIDAYVMLPHVRAGCLFAFTARGSSMLGAGIQDGDYILFDGEKGQDLRDGIYVFALDGETYCKRIEIDGLAKKIKIYSVRVPELVKAELVRELSLDEGNIWDRLIIFGRVVCIIRPYKQGN